MLTRRQILTASIAAAAAAIPTTAGLTRRMPSSNRPVPTVTVWATTKHPIPKLPTLAAMLQRYAELITPAWGVSAHIVAGTHPNPRTWNLGFVDVDENFGGGVLAYHGFDGRLPLAFIDVPACLAADGNVTEGATHELAEMMVNPNCGYWADAASFNPSGGLSQELLALEIADPVEGYAFALDGLKVSDFVFPAYFELWRDGRIDYAGAIASPQQVGQGGYQAVRTALGVHERVGPDARLLKCERHTGIMRRWHNPEKA